ncbi:unnamed protein product [Diatraea saccharalis]|uniref:Uncharacterized protein n=1 Tax=Diatraea saccharalis TaxID=40085 RepID=A0A9N9R3B1_9NEOP|nr:unnamed protein product [Diatraea saccharalis]
MEEAFLICKIILIALIFATNVVCQKSSSKESVEDAIAITSQNTTTLYPISNKTIINKDTKPETIEKIKDATSWKLETAYGESDAVKGEENSQESNEVNKTAEAIKEFKPSPHLGTFLDVDSFDITPTKPTFDDFRPLKKPPTGFISSHKDQFKSSLFYNDEYKYQNDFPYKIESNFFNKAKGNWHHPDLESRPTVEAPVKIPAGGLYRSPDPFKDKPVQSDDDFGLTFNDLKENNHVGAKKRVNPWKNLLQLATALIPVGLIVSALTPSIITVHSVDDAANPSVK